ncbi:recombinase RecJ [Halobacteriales archaeon SW_7_68_16]|nr:MAG: recombinase RecJ [Halobacteriales archaeon SW_7_68_16]
MDETLIDDDTLSLARRSVVPGEGFFYPDELERRERRLEAEERLTGASAAAIADPDADGLGSVALLRVAIGEVALIPAGPNDLDEGLDLVAEFADPGVDVYVCDLCPDEFDAVAMELAAVLDVADGVRWFDHHQWTDDAAAAVRDAGIELTVGESDEECTADVVLRSLGHEFDDRYAELAAVTRDHDLWIKEDPRSDDLADYAYHVDPEEYLATVVEHGVAFPPAVEETIATHRQEKEELIGRAVDRAERHEVGPYTIALTYGRCSQNEVAERLRETGVDATAIVKPSGAASLRGTDAFERCHEVARLLGGGGHPAAAGCLPDIYDDMLDYAHHWTTRGAVARRTILAAFETVIDGADGGATDGE